MGFNMICRSLGFKDHHGDFTVVEWDSMGFNGWEIPELNGSMAGGLPANRPEMVNCPLPCLIARG
jgi:hypothetical protein